MTRCPGQDQRYWTVEDIFDVCCPYCDAEIEFWKDEPFRLCRSCEKEVRNPRINLGCAKWCKFSEQCLGKNINEQLAAAPIIEKLKALAEERAKDEPALLGLVDEMSYVSDLLLTAEGGDPCRIKTSALLIAVLRNDPALLDSARSMLSQTIITADECDAICVLLDEVLAGQEIQTVEAAVINDSMVLAGIQQNDLVTESGKMMYALRMKKFRQKESAEETHD